MSKLSYLKYILIDVDGTLTDGKISTTSNGEEILSFSVYDGYSLVKLENYKDRVIVISGRDSLATKNRMHALKIGKIYLGVEDKLKFIKDNLDYLNTSNTLVIGDDYPDLDLFKYFAYSGCPSNSLPLIKKLSKYVSKIRGGDGAVRDILEYYKLF